MAGPERSSLLPYDKKLAGRVRKILASRRNVLAKEMFGGVCFMIGGHMACGIVEDRLMVRLTQEEAAARLGEPHVKPMDYTGRPLRGFLFVGHDGIRTAAPLRQWVERAAAFAEARPPRKQARR
jgi:TfoX/Sxy family transcriptional regulator of competence genes